MSPSLAQSSSRPTALHLPIQKDPSLQYKPNSTEDSSSYESCPTGRTSGGLFLFLSLVCGSTFVMEGLAGGVMLRAWLVLEGIKSLSLPNSLTIRSRSLCSTVVALQVRTKGLRSLVAEPEAQERLLDLDQQPRILSSSTSSNGVIFLELSNVPRVAAIVPFGLCFNSTNMGSMWVGPAVPAIDLVLYRETVLWRIFRANSMVQVSEEFDLGASRLGFSSSLLFRQTTCANFNFHSMLREFQSFRCFIPRNRLGPFVRWSVASGQNDCSGQNDILKTFL
ncbi:hypothetical protein C3L33_14944, partial [Rhododendron williamsianum]